MLPNAETQTHPVAGSAGPPQAFPWEGAALLCRADGGPGGSVPPGSTCLPKGKRRGRGGTSHVQCLLPIATISEGVERPKSVWEGKDTKSDVAPLP